MSELILNKIYQGDCLEVLKTFPDECIDCVVTDPPYGIKFMGKKWDYGIPKVELWEEVLRVLKPGGHILCACGTRTQHRMAVNLEDAGFEIRDILAWVYSSGFPKSMDIGKAINKIDGVEFEERPAEGVGFMKPDSEDWHITKHQLKQKGGDSERAKEWNGWGTGLKPAMELFTLARKPISEKTIAENVLKYGTGGVNIDECRVETNDIRKGGATTTGNLGWKPNNKIYTDSRFPSNFIHDGSEEVLDLFPETHSGERKSSYKIGNENGVMHNHGIYGKYKAKIYKDIPKSKGSAARFFYCAKASPSERKVGLGNANNFHPTVKPIKLMQYLVRLITPKNGIVLDPFAGSGTTGIACVLEDKNYILIEKEKEYCEIAEARIKPYKQQLKLLA